MENEKSKLKADLVIADCSQLVTCKKDALDFIGVIENGWIAVVGEKIAALGSKEEVMNAVDCSKAKVISGKEKVVVPGFIDAHTHLIFGGN